MSEESVHFYRNVFHTIDTLSEECVPYINTLSEECVVYNTDSVRGLCSIHYTFC